MTEKRWKGGYPQQLVDWYNGGADGAINWGEDGDFEACVAIAGKYIDNPEGFCNERHQDATGAPPGHAPGESEDKKDAPTGAELRDTAIIDYSGRVILSAPLQPGDTVVVTHTGGASDTYDEFEDMDAQLTTQQNASGHQHETRDSTINGQATRSADVAGKFSPVMVTAYRTGEAEHIAMALKKLYPEAYVAGLLASATGDPNSPTAQAIQNTPILLALTEDLDGTMSDVPATVADATGTDWEAAKGLLNLLSDATESGTNIAQYIGSDGAPNTEAQATQMATTESANGAEAGAQDAASAAGYSQMQSVPDDGACSICQDKAGNAYDIGDDGPPWHPSCGCESQPAGSADNTEQTSALGRHVRRWGKRDWQQWDLEHPYVPKDDGGFKQSTSVWSKQPENWTPKSGGPTTPQDPRAPTSEDLSKAVDTWNGGKSAVALSYQESEIEGHTSVDPWNTTANGSQVEDNRAQAAALMNAVADGDKSTGFMYRGSIYTNNSLASLSRGESISLPLVGFSDKVDDVLPHATGAKHESISDSVKGGVTDDSTKQSDVVWQLEPGAKTYPTGTGEHVTAGQFTITGIHTSDMFPDNRSRTVVHLEQSAPLTSPKGGFR